MKKTLWLVVLSLFCFIPLRGMFASTPSSIHNYTAKRIKLAEYQYQNGKPVLGTFSVSWWELEAFHIAIDDKHNIYVLDIYGKKVLHLSPDGALMQEIILKDINFPYTNRNMDDGYMDYGIQVSSDGSLLYVSDGFNEYSWTIFADKGTPIKRNILIYAPFNRACNDNSGFTTDSAVVDKNLDLVKEVTKHVYGGEMFDSTFSFYSLDQSPKVAIPSISKISADRRMIWKKEIRSHKKALRLIGVDVENNIFILTDGPAEILKMNKDGEPIANISFPNDPIFEGGKFAKGIFRVLCDGTIYYLPPYLPVLSDQSQKDKRQYAVFKFVKHASEYKNEDNLSIIKTVMKAMQNKKYDGDSKLYSEQDIKLILPQDVDEVKKLFIKALRNEIYARHGRIFTTSEMKQIFESAPWYKPKANFKESELNEIEKKNVEFIFEYEKKMSWKQ